MDISKVYEIVQYEIGEVEKELLLNLDSSVDMVNDVAAYVFESGGKRLRPVFLVLVSKLFGYEGRRNVVLSGVVEYIHTATLLHDDVIDGAKYRRGRKSANNVFGNDITVLCGDFLYSRSFINLVKDGDPRVQMILADAAKTMSEGEVFQLVKTADFGLKMDDYQKIIFSKTAVLFSACCEIGGILGEATDTKIALLKEFGKTVGLAFQMSDDILDYLGDPEKTGKKPGTDLREGKLTLPVLLLRDRCNKSERAELRQIITSEEPCEKDLKFMLELMDNYNIKSEAEHFVDSYVLNAKSIMEQLPQNEFSDALNFLSEYVIKRDR